MYFTFNYNISFLLFPKDLNVIDETRKWPRLSEKLLKLNKKRYDKKYKLKP